MIFWGLTPGLNVGVGHLGKRESKSPSEDGLRNEKWPRAAAGSFTVH